MIGAQLKFQIRVHLWYIITPFRFLLKRSPQAWTGVSNTRPAMLFGNFQIINIYVAKCLEKRCSEIIESKLNDARCGFHPGRSITDQIFTLQQIFMKSWECGKDVYTCFADLLEKACDRIPREKLWGHQSFWRFRVKSLHSCSEVCVRVGRVKSRPFILDFGLRQGCVLSPLLFIRALSRQSPGSQRGFHSSELRDQPFDFYRRFGAAQRRTQKIFMGVFHSLSYGGHLYLLCAICDVKIWRHIHVSKPTLWRSLLTQYAYSSTRTLLILCVIALNMSALQVTISEENTLNATMQQFITAQMSGWELKQGSKTHSSLRQSNLPLQFLHLVDKWTSKKYAKTINLRAQVINFFVTYHTQGGFYLQPPHLAYALGTALAPSQQGLQHTLYHFFAVCDRAGMKISTKIPGYDVSLETQGSVCSEWAAMHCSS